jgi:DNA-binding response OmpR family regulator
MGQVGRILIADDEETFSQSTADLLRQEGYQCDCVPDAAVGIEKLDKNNYDLLIADIKMPGNRDLEFVQDLPKLAEGTPAIIVTGYPSRKSAIQAVGLPVVAYMVKPIDFKQLLENVNIAIEKSHFHQTVANIRKRLQYWQERLADIEKNLSGQGGKATSSSVKNFIELTVENAIGALADIKRVAEPKKDVNRLACRLLDCPTKNELVGAVEETIKALEKTKGAFKSKDLGTVRKKLEDVLKKAKKN